MRRSDSALGCDSGTEFRCWIPTLLDECQYLLGRPELVPFIAGVGVFIVLTAFAAFLQVRTNRPSYAQAEMRPVRSPWRKVQLTAFEARSLRKKPSGVIPTASLSTPSSNQAQRTSPLSKDMMIPEMPQSGGMPVSEPLNADRAAEEANGQVRWMPPNSRCPPAARRRPRRHSTS